MAALLCSSDLEIRRLCGEAPPASSLSDRFCFIRVSPERKNGFKGCPPPRALRPCHPARHAPDSSFVPAGAHTLASYDIPIGTSQVSLAQLNERSREIFRQIVESYLATGEPVGSRNLSRLLPITLSPASVRNVMSDLEQLGMIYARQRATVGPPSEVAS